MPVFITIQGETCFIMCSDTSPHTRYERQISPFMHHWAGTWSWIIKTNRHRMTQNRSEEKDGKQEERSHCSVLEEVIQRFLQHSGTIPTISWQLQTVGWPEALFQCVSSCLSWVPGKSMGFTIVCWILVSGYSSEDSPRLGLRFPRKQTEVKISVWEVCWGDPGMTSCGPVAGGGLGTWSIGNATQVSADPGRTLEIGWPYWVVLLWERKAVVYLDVDCPWGGRDDSLQLTILWDGINLESPAAGTPRSGRNSVSTLRGQMAHHSICFRP